MRLNFTWYWEKSGALESTDLTAGFGPVTLLSDRTTAVLDTIRAYPDVPLAPCRDSDRVERMIRDAIRRAESAR